MALGQAYSLLIPHQFAVVVAGDGEAQRAIQQNLASGGFQQVGPADDFAYLHRGIIDYYRQLIRRNIIFSPDDEIAEIYTGHHSLWAQMQIGETDSFAIRDAKTPIHSRWAASLRFGSTA